MTDIEIKLITSVDMHLIIQDGIRGGKCEPIYYHAKANNKDNEKESHIISLGANSLHASAMCYKLPYGKPTFDHNISKYTTECILNLDPYGQHLFVFVMDIHYPKKFHDRDFEFPILCDQSLPPCDKNKTKNIMSTFYDKKNYTISLHMLKYCLEKGFKLKKNILCDIRWTIWFYEALYFFECSINKDKIGVELFKLMSNSNFVKQIDNVTKNKDTRIANNGDKVKKIPF